MAGFLKRTRIAWNVFTNKLPEPKERSVLTSNDQNYANVWRDTNERVLAPILTRIAIDAAMVPVYHVDVDEHGNFVRIRHDSELNQRLNRQANIDQTGYDFMRDVFHTMLSTGVVATVPVITSAPPLFSDSYDIYSWRTGRVLEYFNKYVKLSVYDEEAGERRELELPKSFVSLSENPFYLVMNEPNSTLKRLIDKLVLLDIADARHTSPSLDLLLQLSYAVKTETQEAQAQKRLAQLERQLYDSAYGIAYIGATEKITQLNRPVINTLPEQVDKLTLSLYNQLGLSEAIFTGSASQEEQVIYYNRTIAPILKAFTDAAKVSFLTKTAISQGQSIMAFPDLFKMAPIDVLADAADKLSRNEIMTSNELRSRFGLPPVDNPDANELRNKNLNKATDSEDEEQPPTEPEEDESDET
jgi:hypothetical protein